MRSEKDLTTPSGITREEPSSSGNSAAATLRYASAPSQSGIWRHRFAQVIVGATFFLIVAGGNVTSKGVGMAVPDWPTSFGSFNPDGWTTNMGGRIPGVRDEHFHRLVGAAVGLLITSLAIWLWKSEPRAWVRRLGFASLLAVLVQGLMGGFRVTEISLTLAILHGCFAQAVLCLLIMLAMVLSPRWSTAPSASSNPEADAGLRRWTALLVGCVYLQLVLGAVFRHTGMGAMGIIHVCGALVVGGLLIQAANFTMARSESDRLAGLTIGLFLLYGLQVILGVAAYLAVLSMDGRNPVGWIQTYAPTLHVAVGAAILGTSFAMVLRSFAVTAPADRGFPVKMTNGEVLA